VNRPVDPARNPARRKDAGVARLAARLPARPVLAAFAALLAALVAAGCVSVPTGGPVQSYPVTQGTDAQNQNYVQIVPQPPGAGWSPQDIVQGFLTASASFGDNGQIAFQYLTPQEQKVWTRSWSAIVYKQGPNVEAPRYPSPKNKNEATVQITGQTQATLKGYGSYSVASASSASSSSDVTPTFELVKVAGQWRINYAPPELLLTSDSFTNDYQLRNLYFFDPASRFLVPDPVYVPLQASPAELMNGLVHDLIAPPDDWLSGGATQTALPAGTKIGGVTLNGVTALVDLTGTIAKAGISTQTLELVSAQLLWTLCGAEQSGQPVQSVELELNGKPWVPPGGQGNPVQVQHQSKRSPAQGAGSVFYYVDSAGYLTSQDGALGKPDHIEQIGTGYTQVAVSPDGRYLAALRGQTLYTGLVGGPLDKRGSDYLTISWDVNDNLWASVGDQIVMFKNAVGIRQPLGQMIPVNVGSASSGLTSVTGPFTALRVAPDGVRVAIVIGGSLGNVLTFGAISGEQGSRPQIMLSDVQLTPLNATAFTGLTWYGPDDVITLAQPGPAATEYPVSGGTPTSIPVDDGMETITASSGNLLVASMPDGRMMADASLTGSWTLIGTGSSPVYPG